MKKLLSEPFVHFVLLGIALFVLYGLLNQGASSRNAIVIDDFDIENIVASWELKWNRPPNEDELLNLIDQEIRQEVLYQEALVMNLDHNDEIIKRRLSQKMNFLANDVASFLRPSEEELRDYYKSNSEKFTAPTSYTMYQIVFTPDNRTNSYEDAEKVLKQHSDATSDEMKNKGDYLPLNYHFEDVSEDELLVQFGSSFAKSLKDAEAQKWTGPILSGLGFHLVYIEERIPQHLPDFNAVEQDVLREYEYHRQKEVSESMYTELRRKYDIDFDLDSEKFGADFIVNLQRTSNN